MQAAMLAEHGTNDKRNAKDNDDLNLAVFIVLVSFRMWEQPAGERVTHDRVDKRVVRDANAASVYELMSDQGLATNELAVVETTQRSAARAILKSDDRFPVLVRAHVPDQHQVLHFDVIPWHFRILERIALPADVIMIGCRRCRRALGRRSFDCRVPKCRMRNEKRWKQHQP
ncbi:hypothetical protein [Caballeronia sp. INDeC2]|uniref:hypothetical protein n=1 Tax=Caballeronia sp. INDeC2 TaxID=2921747 RepID=UPI0020288150|nr:hypothetical protein [Caballeronia sp. INDeC2]